MELFLRPLEDVNDVTWSIIWLLVILLAGVAYVIYYILGIDERESLKIDHERRKSGRVGDGDAHGS